MRFPTMWYALQPSLRSACAYAQSDLSLCLSLEYTMTVKLLTKQHLVFLGLKGGCTGSSESTLVKMPHVAAQIQLTVFRKYNTCRHHTPGRAIASHGNRYRHNLVRCRGPAHLVGDGPSLCTHEIKVHLSHTKETSSLGPRQWRRSMYCKKDLA